MNCCIMKVIGLAVNKAVFFINFNPKLSKPC